MGDVLDSFGGSRLKGTTSSSAPPAQEPAPADSGGAPPPAPPPDVSSVIQGVVNAALPAALRPAAAPSYSDAVRTIFGRTGTNVLGTGQSGGVAQSTVGGGGTAMPVAGTPLMATAAGSAFAPVGFTPTKTASILTSAQAASAADALVARANQLENKAPTTTAAPRPRPTSSNMLAPGTGTLSVRTTAPTSPVAASGSSLLKFTAPTQAPATSSVAAPAPSAGAASTSAPAPGSSSGGSSTSGGTGSGAWPDNVYPLFPWQQQQYGPDPNATAGGGGGGGGGGAAPDAAVAPEDGGAPAAAAESPVLLGLTKTQLIVGGLVAAAAWYFLAGPGKAAAEKAVA